MQSAAEAIRKQVEAEQRILRLHESLGAAEASAEASLQVYGFPHRVTNMSCS